MIKKDHEKIKRNGSAKNLKKKLNKKFSFDILKNYSAKHMIEAIKTNSLNFWEINQNMLNNTNFNNAFDNSKLQLILEEFEELFIDQQKQIQALSANDYIMEKMATWIDESFEGKNWEKRNVLIDNEAKSLNVIAHDKDISQKPMLYVYYNNLAKYHRYQNNIVYINKANELLKTRELKTQFANA